MQDVTLYMVDFVSENRRDRIATEDKCDLEDWIVRINKAIELIHSTPKKTQKEPQE